MKAGAAEIRKNIHNGVQTKPNANLNNVIPVKTGTTNPFSLLYPVIPAKAGIQKATAHWQANPSMNGNRQIPSPLMGEG